MQEYILIIDYGSQYTQLISKRIRKLGVFSKIVSSGIVPKIEKAIKGIVLSGGPNSVYEKDAPTLPAGIFDLNIPVLGVCYGFQLITKHFQGEIKKGTKTEYGRIKVDIEKGVLFNGIKKQSIKTWMSHSDIVSKPPLDFKIKARSENNYIVAIENKKKKIYGLQFHPEVTHTEMGDTIVKNFIDLCNVKKEWNLKDEINNMMDTVKKKVEDKKVALAISGGVDSTVLAVLLKKAIGDNLIPIFINNGFLRYNEEQERFSMFKKLGLSVHYIDACDHFLDELSGVKAPEQKRKIIGRIFIEEFEKFIKGRNVEFLAQGTLYPDVIESMPVYGKSSKIKLHHNVGGLPKKLNLKLIEPFRYFFKDEVREIGRHLNIANEVLFQHPFPGPGLAVRVIGEVNKRLLDILREVDRIYIEELKKNDLYYKIWQALAVILPVKSTGVKGDVGVYENVAILRAVTSVDGMTADWFQFDTKFLQDLSNKITNEVPGINRVVYDITSKPPATIEWE